MLAWHALLVQKIDLRVRGLAVHKLQVNRHRVTEVHRHAHAHAQAILYLSGEGRQLIGARSHPARPGELFLLPGNCTHGFAPVGDARPICLVLDFERAAERRAPAPRVVHRRLEPAALNQLHALISRLPRKGRLHLADYATVIAVVALLFDPRHVDAAAGAAESGARAHENLLARVRGLLLDPELADAPLAKIARRAGYHPDHLTRVLRRAAGCGLRDLRDALRLEVSLAALRRGERVADAAAAAGFYDPAYFARWLRRHTGKIPGAFRVSS